MWLALDLKASIVNIPCLILFVPFSLQSTRKRLFKLSHLEPQFFKYFKPRNSWSLLISHYRPLLKTYTVVEVSVKSEFFFPFLQNSRIVFGGSIQSLVRFPLRLPIPWTRYSEDNRLINPLNCINKMNWDLLSRWTPIPWYRFHIQTSSISQFSTATISNNLSPPFASNLITMFVAETKDKKTKAVPYFSVFPISFGEGIL